MSNNKPYGIVYKITNLVNNKCYIGITTQRNGFRSRYESKGEGIERVYRSLLRCKDNGNYYNIHLLSSIEKYGLDVWEVIEEFDVAYSQEELCEKEKKYINEYKSYDSNFGYNLSLGGEGAMGIGMVKVVLLNNGRIFDSVNKASDEFNLHPSGISSCLSGTINSSGLCSKTGERLVWVYYDEYLNMTEEEKKEKMEIAEDGNINYSIKITCLNTGVTYDSINDAQRKTGFNRIGRCIDGERKSCGKDPKTGEKLVWVYYKDYINMSEEEIQERIDKVNLNKAGQRTKITCLNINETFSSLSEAKKYFNFTTTNGISQCLSGKYESSGVDPKTGERLVWVYYYDYINMSEEEIKHLIKKANTKTLGSNNPNSKKIVMLDKDNKEILNVFSCIKEIKEELNFDTISNISAVCRGIYKTSFGYKWAYLKDYLEQNPNMIETVCNKYEEKYNEELDLVALGINLEVA